MPSPDQIIQLLDQYPEQAQVSRWYRRKNSGGFRPVTSPNDELKSWLREMNKALAGQFNDWPTFMHGGIKRRSYVTFAKPHVNKPCVITIDVRKCFDSITEQELAPTLSRHLGVPDKASVRLAKSLCFNGRVAQGFPTSNYVCNLYLLDPLSNLHKALKDGGLVLGNYVDDIAISGAMPKPDTVVNQVARELSRSKLAVNKAKIKVMPSSKPQIVCGLLVNKRLSLTKKKKLELLSSVARGRMNSASVAGWAANLEVIDPAFRKKFLAYATKKGVV